MMTHRFSVLAWGGFCLSLALAAGAVLLLLTTASGMATLPDLIGTVAYIASGAITAAVGALVAARRNRNPLGWILLAIGLALTAQQFTQDYAGLAFGAAAGPLPAQMLALWMSQWLWQVPYLGLALLLPIFPTGHPLSPRWRWVVILSAVIHGALMMLWMIVTPMTISTSSGEEIAVQNPIGVVALDADSESGLLSVILGLLILTMLGAVLALWLRFIRARDVERQQLKWLLYAAALFVAALIATSIFNDEFFSALIDVVALGMPLSVGIAILRYRLWDIDLIIRRTLQYSLLSGLLALAYFGSIIVLQGLLAVVGNQQSEFVIVASTLAIAALFLPLRRRVQDFIDRRFYRKKYDAQKVLADFAATARDETDLEKLTARLVDVAQETMQPESVNVWLKPTADRRRPPSFS